MTISDALPYIAIFAAVFVMMPSPLDPVTWKTVRPLPVLQGGWAPNHVLNNTKRIGDGKFRGPESMVFDDKGGYVYSGVGDGRVIRVSTTGNQVEDFFFVGGFLKSMGSADGLSDTELLDWCRNESLAYRLPWNEMGEQKCGRPLGLRLKQVDGVGSVLYILDAYHGLFTITLETKSVQHVFTPDICTTKTSTFSHKTDAVVDKPCRFINDLDVSSDGTVYFTDSSYKHSRSHNREEILDGAPRGRLFAYFPREHTVKALLCGLHFPNGVQLLPGEKTLLVAESTRMRILKLDLPLIYFQHATSDLLSNCGENSQLTQTISTPETAGDTGISVFIDQVPGFIDNIRLDEVTKDELYISLGTKISAPFSLLWIGYKYNVLWYILGRIIPMKYVTQLVPKYGLIGVIGLDGTVKTSFHDPSGSISFVSESLRHPITHDLWLGSHSNDFIGLLESQFLVNNT
eukprot:gene6986-14200_t